MTDRTLRYVVAGLTGLLVLVIAVTFVIMNGRSGTASSSPTSSVPPIGSAAVSPSAVVSPSGKASPSPSASPTAAATPSAAASATPLPAPLATLTFLGLKLDASADAAG